MCLFQIRKIQHAVCYSQLSPIRFKNFGEIKKDREGDGDGGPDGT
jgi:hypothetical protein